MSAVSVVVLVVILVGVALVIAGTIRKNRWGINLRAVTCPSCGTPQKAIRTPTSIGRALWGGNTCPYCGTEMDKWGRRIEAN